MLYPGSRFRMADDLLETYIRQLIEAHASAPEVNVAWQGGEPTLMGLDFFRLRWNTLISIERPTSTSSSPFRPTARKLDDQWCAFFKQHNFLVGISIDGRVKCMTPTG